MSDTIDQATDQLVEQQKELEYLYSKNQCFSRVKEEFKTSSMEFEQFFIQHQINTELGLDALTHMAILKKATLPALVGLLKKHGPLQEIADTLSMLVDLDVIQWTDATRTFTFRYGISDEVQRELDMFQFPLPMIVPPKTITHNKMGGYLLNSASIILKDNYHNDDVCLDHINRCNQVRLTINRKVATVVQNTWKSLDRPKEGEDHEKYVARLKAFHKYNQTAHAVMDILMEKSSAFYITHRYDKRGRTYSMGYHVNPQGNPWNKAVIEFADKELMPNE